MTYRVLAQREAVGERSLEVLVAAEAAALGPRRVSTAVSIAWPTWVARPAAGARCGPEEVPEVYADVAAHRRRPRV